MTINANGIALASPPTLDHVIGQRRAVEQLRVALEARVNDRAAHRGGEPPVLGHILLVGGAGLGKSMLATTVALELGSTCHEELANNISSPAQLQGLLMLAEQDDVVFVDEVHELVSQTTLYRALEERKLFLPAGPDGKRQVIGLPPFTFVAATTDEWALSKPLRDRFKLVLRLEYYSDEDLFSLVRQRAQRLGWKITDSAVRGISVRGRGTPRIAIRLLEATRRMSRSRGAEVITINDFNATCNLEGIDRLGLDPLEQKYLTILRESQVPVRLNVLATRLGLPPQTIERVIEADLIRLELITKDDAGRVLTAQGREHLSPTR